MFLSKKTQLVAIDIGSSSIKLVQLSEIKEGEFELTHFGMMPLAEEWIVEGVIKEPERVAEALKNLIKAEKIQSRYAVSAVAGEAVFIKKIKVPVKLEGELSEKITQEAEQYIPLDRKSTRLNSSHVVISYAVFCLKKKKNHNTTISHHTPSNAQ